MAIIKYEKMYGLPEELSDEFLIFDEGKWINKCEIDVNGETREFICVYERKKGSLTHITYGESISVLNSNRTVFSIRGWRINVNKHDDSSYEELFNPDTLGDYVFKVHHFMRPPSFVEGVAMIKEMERKGYFNREYHSNRK